MIKTTIILLLILVCTYQACKISYLNELTEFYSKMINELNTDEDMQ